jgi:hypothetical protein
MDSGIAGFEAMHMEDLGFEIDIGNFIRQISDTRSPWRNIRSRRQ